ncbi:MAG: hypothetical protein OQK50_06645 [Deltaproteobacteria bacterium]|nr:hypothetical protein [Deltaproteobacteria bacterium]
MYGLSLAAVYFYSVMLVADVFGWKNETGNVAKGIAPLISSVVIFYVAYYVFFWNILGNFGITYFSPQALIATGGTGLEIWNARENSSLAILFVMTALIWVTMIWNTGFGNSPWDGLQKRVIGFSKFSATAFISTIFYAIFFHPNITALFQPKQIFAGVLPWWDGIAMTASSFYHLGWMFAGLFILMFLNDCMDGFPFNLFRSEEKSGSWIGAVVALVIAVVGGYIFMYIAEAIMSYYWYEPFTGGNYTDDPRFRHVHTAEIAAFFMLALMVVKVFFNNVVEFANKWLTAVIRLVVVSGAGMLLYFFYYSETLGPVYVDRVPGTGNIDATSLCWTIMSMALILVYDKFFNAFPIRK